MSDFKEGNDKKVIYYIILFIEHSWNDKIIKMENRLAVARVQGAGWVGSWVVIREKEGSL